MYVRLLTNGLTVSPTIFMYVSTALVANVLPRNIRFSFSANIHTHTVRKMQLVTYSRVQT